MFCPQCGQQQASKDVRFCSSCGFPLNVVSEVLTGGGQLQWRPPEGVARQLSPKQKGMRQGAMLMLSVLVVMPIVIFLGVALLNLPGELIPLAGAICVMGGLLRILYAALFEDGTAGNVIGSGMPMYMPPATPPNYLGGATRGDALPASNATPATNYRPPRYRTDELAPRPSSVTENTTRLLPNQPDDPRPNE
ncbi:MAG: zinc ribbon domain-containing protein [Pyrinomonadaceae bacterium]